MPVRPAPDAPPESLRGPRIIALVALLAVLALLYAAFVSRAQPVRLLPLPTGVSTEASGTAPSQAHAASVVLAGGCFWGVQAVFQHTQGVLNAVSGYAGGSKETASWP